MEPKIISYRLDGITYFAIFEMIDGSPRLTPCTAEGTPLVGGEE